MKSVFAIGLIWSVTLAVDAQPRINTTEFTRADSIAELFPRHSLVNVARLSSKLTSDLQTEEGKFRAIYKWICLNIENDYEMYRYIKRKRDVMKDSVAIMKWTRQTNRRVIAALIDHHKTVCTGYAFLLKDLCYHAGIRCEMVDGYGRSIQNTTTKSMTPNHTWNAVMLNGDWYLCDATWSAGANDPATGRFVPHFDEGYFLCDPTLFARKHYPLDRKWFLLPKTPSLDHFFDAPVTYGAANRHKIVLAFPEKMVTNVSRASEVKYTLRKNDPQAMCSVEIIRDHQQPQNIELIPEENENYSFTLKFEKKGRHLTHILLNGEYAFTTVTEVD